MQFSKLTFVNAVLLPLTLGLGACFFGGDDSLDSGAIGGTGGAPCPTGGPGCPCTGGDACDPGLTCQTQLGTCVLPDGCPTGSPGCECTMGGACDEGFICMENTCVSEMPCLPEDTGTESCQCTEGGGCDPDLMCLSGICVHVPDDESTTGSPMTGGSMTGMTSEMTSSTGSTGGESGNVDSTSTGG
jgi:hypothetical protein